MKFVDTRLSSIPLESFGVVAIVDVETLFGAASKDRVIIMRFKSEIHSLLMDNENDLLRLLTVNESSDSFFEIPTPSDPLWPKFDGVRMREQNGTGSTTIISMDHFSQSTTSFNILSNDGRRIQRYRHANGGKFYCINQATRLNNALVIQHEQYTLSGKPIKCCHDCYLTATVFGRTANTLMTGVWVYEDREVHNHVEEILLQSFTLATGQEQDSRSTLKACSTDQLPSTFSKCGCPVSFTKEDWFFAAYDYERPIPRNLFTNTCKELNQTYENIIVHPFEKATHSMSSPFARNSVFGYITVKGQDDQSVKVLWKQCQFQRDEVEGAEEAAKFYPLVQRARIARSGELIYPYFDGKSQFEIRVSYIRGGRNDESALEILLHLELRKCEDVLRACLGSFQMSNTLQSPRVQRIFHDRAKNDNARFCEVYRNGIYFNEVVVPLYTFLTAPILVNDIKYPSFIELTRKADVLLSPSKLGHGYVFGLGDCHGGNILLENVSCPLSHGDILYIDYEFAGFHPFSLDLANPFFLDVFFDIMYNDATLESPSVQAAFKNGVVTIDMSLPKDLLNSAIFEIKLRYLIEPFLEFMNSQGGDVERALAQFSCALFICGTSKQRFPCSWDDFFVRLAVGVVCSQISKMTDIRRVWETLNG